MDIDSIVEIEQDKIKRKSKDIMTPFVKLSAQSIFDYFSSQYKISYGRSYITRNRMVDVNIILSLLEMLTKSEVTGMIDILVKDYDKLTGVDTEKYPLPCVGTLRGWARELQNRMLNPEKFEEKEIEQEELTEEHTVKSFKF